MRIGTLAMRSGTLPGSSGTRLSLFGHPSCGQMLPMATARLPALCFCLLVIAFVPALALWLPQALGY